MLFLERGSYVKITVNDQPVELFKGATLKHALLKVNEQLYKEVMGEKAVITDQDGNVTDINGAVGDGFSYYVRTK